MVRRAMVGALESIEERVVADPRWCSPLVGVLGLSGCVSVGQSDMIDENEKEARSCLSKQSTQTKGAGPHGSIVHRQLLVVRWSSFNVAHA